MLTKPIIRRYFIALTVIVVVVAAWPTYYLRTEAVGDLFWNSDEVYVVLHRVQSGYRTSRFMVLVEFAREIFPFGASAPSDKHSSVAMLRVTPDSIQRYTVHDFWLGSIEPFEGELYGGNLLPGGVLMKWSKTHFVRPNSDELKRYYASANELPAGPSYDNIQGWSRRAVGGDVIRESAQVYTEDDTSITIELSGKPLTFIMNSGYISHEAYVDLVRYGKAPERIWYLDQRTYRISRTEYQNIFAGHRQ